MQTRRGFLLTIIHFIQKKFLHGKIFHFLCFVVIKTVDMRISLFCLQSFGTSLALISLTKPSIKNIMESNMGTVVSQRFRSIIWTRIRTGKPCPNEKMKLLGRVIMEVVFM